MVDLVKIRKKAREKKSAQADPHPPSGHLLPQAGEGTPAAQDRIAQFLETAGKSRIKATATDVETAEQIEILTFSIAGELYGVGIEHVVEIVTPRAVTRVPNAGETIVGILSLRGTIVTLLDIRRRLGHPPGEMTPETRVIVVEHQDETLGFLVDLVLRVVKVDPAAIGPHPVVHPSEYDESVRGVFRYNEALTILLDLDRLLTY